MQRVPFFRHDLGAAELAAVAEVLAGPILTTGETVQRFEERFATYLHCDQVVAVSSCTAALHLALLALDIGPGDEVITTPLTFAATATAILQAGATPVFVDVEPTTGNLDAGQVERALSSRTRALMPVHLYGQMCDMRAIGAIADRHGLRIIEDAAHCIEGSRDGIRPAQQSAAACFSFYATKNLACGEGGAIATNEPALARKLRLLRLHGMTKTGADRAREGYIHWDMEIFGWKYNLDNIHAALLLPQLDRLEDNWRRRDILARRYTMRLATLAGVQLPRTVPGVRHARHLFPVWVTPAVRDPLVRGMHLAGIDVMVNYRPVHLLAYFRKRFGYRSEAFPCAEQIGATTLSLPFYPKLDTPAADQVVDVFREVLERTSAPMRKRCLDPESTVSGPFYA